MNKQSLETLIKQGGRAGLPNDRETLFQGWFGNHMAILIMYIQSKYPMKEETRMRMQFFLFDLEHHYLNPRADRYFRNAFRFLRYYLKARLNVCAKHSKRTLEMIARIHEGLGIVCHLESIEKEEFVCVRIKKEIHRGIHETLKTLNSVPAHC